MDRIADILGGSLPGRTRGRIPPSGLLAAWRELTGPLAAGRAYPVALEEGGVLVVAVRGAVWKQELTLAAPDLTAKLRERGHAVESLKLVAGRTPAPPPPPKPPPPPPTPEQVEAAREMTREVADPLVREALQRAITAQLTSRKS